MQRGSQTRLAVLGALSTGPMTGYEVRAAITDVLGHFWRESFGQIYPTLAALERDGAIERASAGRTSGSTFAITETGQRLLRELLAEPYLTQPPRNGLLLRLFFGTHLADGQAADLLAAAAETGRAALADYAAIRAAEPTEPESLEAAFRLMTLSYGEHLAAAQLAWAEESLAVLRRHSASDSVEPSPAQED